MIAARYTSTSFLGHNQSAHGHKLKVMNDRFSVWIEKHNRVVGSALKLEERPVMDHLFF